MTCHLHFVFIALFELHLIYSLYYFNEWEVMKYQNNLSSSQGAVPLQRGTSVLPVTFSQE